MAEQFLPCNVIIADNLQKAFKEHDAVCIVDKQVPSTLSKFCSEMRAADKAFAEMRSVDKAFDSEVSCFKVTDHNSLIVYSPVEKITDYKDVRIYQTAAVKAVKRAVKAGAKNPAFALPSSSQFPQVNLISVLGALEGLYVPIQLRENVPSKEQQVESLTFLVNNEIEKKIVEEALILERGRFIARDIGVGDPERMTAPKVEEYVRAAFPDLKIWVVDDVEELRKGFPLFAAVDRAAQVTERHRGRVIFMEYKPETKARKSLLLVGKGVTMDTGGADLKVNGVMTGMSRDKCGAAAVAGFMSVVQQRKPKDIHVIAALCMVRNSIGEECYTCDEVITSRAGVRVRIGNTDAEGRMCMTDPLCYMKELAIDLPNPHIFTIATLTGHAYLSAGCGYSIVLDNSVARKSDHSTMLQKVGEEFGDPFEISTLRQDDFSFVAAKSLDEDVIQCNCTPSSKTPRGHQFPAAFMMIASGLDKHDLSSEKPIKYTHLDIAGSAGDYPYIPTGSPIIALVKAHLDS